MIVVDRTNVPAVAFQHDDGSLWYARRTGGVWTAELVDATAYSYPFYAQNVGLALDTFNADAPFLAAVGENVNGYRSTRIYRKNAASWLSAMPTWTPTQESGYRGGLVVTASNTLKFTYSIDDDGMYIGQYVVGSGFTASSTVSNCSSPSLAYCYDRYTGATLVKGGSALGVLWGPGLSWSANGTTGWGHNPIEDFEIYGDDVVWDGTSPRLMTRHSSELEFVRPDSRNYWSWTTVDTGTGGSGGTAVDASGNQHGCYSKSSAIYFY